MIQLNSALRGPMTQFLKTGDLGPSAKPEKPFLGEFGTLMLATESVRPLFQADQVDGVDTAKAPNQVEIDPQALKSNPDFAGFTDFGRVRCDFVGPKEDPDEITIHAKGAKREEVIMASYNGKPDGSAVIRYIQADASSDSPGWLLSGHELTLNAGDSPYDVKCKSQGLLIDVTPSMAD